MVDVNPLKVHRPSRVKLMDAVAMICFHRAQAALKRWTDDGYDAGALVLDGVDPRGAHRAFGATREPVMIASDPDLVSNLERSGRPVGEGDMKLPFLERRVRHLRTTDDAVFGRTRLVITATIDTDALPICVVEAARRPLMEERDHEGANSDDVHSLLMMRERARADLMLGGARYTTVDVAMLEQRVQAHMWGGDPVALRLPNTLLEQAALAFAAARALPGCDFLKLDGGRFDHFFETLPTFVRARARRGELARFSQACSARATTTRLPRRTRCARCARRRPTTWRASRGSRSSRTRCATSARWCSAARRGCSATGRGRSGSTVRRLGLRPPTSR